MQKEKRKSKIVIPCEVEETEEEIKIIMPDLSQSKTVLLEVE